MTYVFVDYETRSPVDLKRCGQDVYLSDAEVVMVGVATEGGDPVVLRDLEYGEHYRFISCEQDELTYVSWGGFDREVATRIDQLIHPNWIDARALAQTVGLPASLEKFCTAIGIEAKKDPRGTRLINRYCRPIEPITPIQVKSGFEEALGTGKLDMLTDIAERLTSEGKFRKLTPEDRQAMEDYCLQDVRLLQQAWRFLSPLVGEWQRVHQANWQTYDNMNRRGVPIDVEACRAALKLIGEQTRAIESECKERFGFSTTQTAKVCEFLGTPDVTKQTLEGYRSKDPDQMWVRDARLVTSRAAAKKLVPMIEMAREGRIRGAFHYHGAHTGRGTSMGVQFQNLKKGVIDFEFFRKLHAGEPIEDPIQQTQQNIRGFIRAEEGKTLVIVDYSQVEARILAWIAGESYLTEAFAAGRDIYREFAARVYGVSQGEVTDTQRAHGKATVLGCGYGMGPKKLVMQAASMGTVIPSRASTELVEQYRRSYPAIPMLWQAIDIGIKGLIRGRHEVFTAGKCIFTINPPRTMLRIELPSGRVLRYFKPSINSEQQIVYLDRNGPVRCWGGHFVENICQAIAGDLKTDFMRRADDHNFHAVMEIHDEVVFEEYEELSDLVLKVALEMMTEVPEWLDCPGLIKGEGKILPRFSK